MTSTRGSGPISNGRALAAIDDPSRGALEAASLYLASKIAAATPVGATANLRNSIQADKVSSIGGRFVASIISNVEYATIVEQGSRPHSAPVGPIAFWVQRKLGLQGKEALQVAWAIRTSIVKRGTSARGKRPGPTGGRGYFMFNDVFERELPEINRRFFVPLGLQVVRVLEGVT